NILGNAVGRTAFLRIVGAHMPPHNTVAARPDSVGEVRCGYAIGWAEESWFAANSLGDGVVGLLQLIQPTTFSMEINRLCVGVGVVAHGVPCIVDLLYDIEVLAHIFSDAEKGCFSMMPAQQFQHLRCVNRMRPVVKSKRYLFVGCITLVCGFEKKVRLDMEGTPRNDTDTDTGDNQHNQQPADHCDDTGLFVAFRNHHWRMRCTTGASK